MTLRTPLVIFIALFMPFALFSGEPQPHRPAGGARYPAAGGEGPTTGPMPGGFNPAESAFTLDNATFMAWLSQVAYLKTETGSPDIVAIRAKLAGIPGATVEPIDSSPVQGFVVKARGYAVVVFRGSDERGDWEDNFQAFYLGRKKTPRSAGDYGRPAMMRREEPIPAQTLNSRHDLHAGFYGQFKSAHDEVLEKLKGVEGSKVWFTGHSLGGALASIFARDFHAAHGFKNIGLYTFGAPRPGNQRLADYFSDSNNKIPAYRIENELDPVPTLPDARFRPVGELVHISQDKSGACSVSDDTRLTTLVRTVRAHVGTAFHTGDHGIGNYVDCLRKIPR